jgi:putative chitinase
MITVDRLIAAGIQPTQAKAFCEPLKAACALHAINSRNRIAAFIGQCAHESLGFTRLEESLFYSTPERIRQMWPSRFKDLGEAAQFIRAPQKLANRVYANRLGNGDESSWDGWKYRGRGLIQLTGRANYMAAAEACRRPYKERPELVAEPSDACLTAAWFWATARLNELADAWMLNEITRRVNGPALAGREDRAERSNRALEAFL